MSAIMDLLGKEMTGEAIKEISAQTGIEEEQAAAVVNGAVPLLLKALARNTDDPQGAEALAEALKQDHDGSILDDIPGFVNQANTAPGQAILKHVLGDRIMTVARGLAKLIGIESETVDRILAILAPIVLAALARQQQSEGLDVGALAGLLGQEKKTAESRAPEAMDILSSLLDGDGDGDISDDVAEMGTKLLTGLLSR
ncbi:MAG: DUF937 domain-containing protein [Leptospiraceae bacterium]|nr:DUF937 domain-containing protein [Leptospiraceae bacterium]MCB1322228.1 DUF937 domain-containing protein [Leptospiraceae bacterium]